MIKEKFKFWNKDIFGNLKEVKNENISKIDELDGLESRKDLEMIVLGSIETKLKITLRHSCIGNKFLGVERLR